MENDLICSSIRGATHRLILLHGWGADAEDLMPLGQELSNAFKRRRLEVIALRAPYEHPGGFGRQWYGLFPSDWAAVPLAIDDLQMRIKVICSNSIALEKTVILGFSQGGAMALAAGTAMPLAGVIGCSAYPHPNWTPSKTSPPVLLLHGKKDDVVPCDASRRIMSFLKANQSEADLVLFDGGHEIKQELFPRIRFALEKWLI